MTTVDRLLQRNSEVAAKHKPHLTIDEMMDRGQAPDTMIVTCGDPRCCPEDFFGLTPNGLEAGLSIVTPLAFNPVYETEADLTQDGVIVMRVVAGRVATSIKDIATLDAYVGLKHILVIHHTDCGASHFKDDHIRETLKERQPYATGLDTMVFGSFDNLEQSLRDDLALLGSSPLIRSELAAAARGFTYDIKSGQLTEVK